MEKDVDGDFRKCRWCGHDRAQHRSGRGSCLHCDCACFRTTGETQEEFFKRHAKNMCEREGGRGHEWDDRYGDCVNCGTKKEDFLAAAPKGA